MKKEDLFEVFEGINDKYVKGAKETMKKNYNNWWKNWTAIAATFVLMVCSFSVGAFVFAREVIVEVPAEQEIISVEELGLSMILPDTWEDKYALEKTDNGEYIVYNPNIRKAVYEEYGIENNGGMLFYLVRWDKQLTENQVNAGGEWDFAKNQYIMTTKNGTYLLYYASDVQFTKDTEEEYREMEKEIKEIRFVVDNALSNPQKTENTPKSNMLDINLYNKNGNVSPNANWYELDNNSTAHIYIEGMQPDTITAYYTHAGTEQEENKIAVGKVEQPYVEVPISVPLTLDGEPRGHLWFVLDFGTYQIESDIYNVINTDL